MGEVDVIEEKLVNLAYRRVRRNEWIKGDQVIHVIHSLEFGRDYIRVWWRERWRDDHAVVFDYSGVKGPVCIMPVSDLFLSVFIKKKRKEESYANSGYWWSQRFPIDHELAKLVFDFKERWDLL